MYIGHLGVYAPNTDLLCCHSNRLKEGLVEDTLLTAVGVWVYSRAHATVKRAVCCRDKQTIYSFKRYRLTCCWSELNGLHVTDVALAGWLQSLLCWSWSSGSSKGCPTWVGPAEMPWEGIIWSLWPPSPWSTAAVADTVLSLLHLISATRSLIDFPTVFASLSWKRPDSTWQRKGKSMTSRIFLAETMWGKSGCIKKGSLRGREKEQEREGKKFYFKRIRAVGNYYFCRQLGTMLTIGTTGLLQQLTKRQYRTLCAGIQIKSFSLCFKWQIMMDNVAVQDNFSRHNTSVAIFKRDLVPLKWNPEMKKWKREDLSPLTETNNISHVSCQ